MKTGASFCRATSRQDYETPADFRQAVTARFGFPNWDLAALSDNYFGQNWIDESDNSLVQKWHEKNGVMWLNPPYKNISSWAKKCCEESNRGAKILFLTPASVGSNWFCDYVFGHALVLFLNGRLQFVGAKDPYPKDCILSCFGFGETGFEIWKWKGQKP